MTPIKFSVAILFLMLFAKSIVASNPANVKQFINHKDWSFVENKGQLTDENGKLTTDVKYYSHDGGAHLYCRPGKISFVFTKIENEPSSISEATGSSVGFPFPKGAGGFGRTKSVPQLSRITTNRIDLILIGSNPNAEITATDQQAYYENFYLAHTSQSGVTHVNTFKTVTYKDIYPYIDMVLNAKQDENMEYSFLIHPGGDINDIKLRWNGLNQAEILKNGGLRNFNKYGVIDESAPKSYVGGKYVSSSFKNYGSYFGFKAANFDKSKDLMIDPEITWATYYGGSKNEGGNSVCVDNSGNVYFTGTTHSCCIGSSGIFQTEISGGSDAFLVKFSNTGKRLWATYYGGSNDDFGYGLALDPSGNLFISGGAYSADLVITSGVYQTSSGYGLDAFIAKFNSSGSLSWASYYGGTASEEAYAVCTDKAGDAYITGYTGASLGMASSGAYQTANAGASDAFLAKFQNSSGSLLWATYYGGTGSDRGRGLCTDTSGNVYLTGNTNSASIMSTSGSFQSALAGNNDAFLLKFSSAGKRIWATYFGGTSDDFGYGVAIDTIGSLYVTGYTISSGIATLGAYQTKLGGSYDGFLAQFSNSGNRVWSTYYGGNSIDEGYGITVDKKGNIFITGQTDSYNHMASSCTLHSSYSGNNDAFLAEFNSAGGYIWATYFGYDDDDGAYGVATDKAGNIFITGGTASQSGIATPGAYETYYTDNYDAFLAKFELKTTLDGGLISIGLANDTICSGLRQLKVQFHNFGSVNITSAVIGSNFSGSYPNTIKWTGNLQPDSTITIFLPPFQFYEGTYNVKAWVTKPNGSTDSMPCNDTVINVVYFKQSPTAKFTCHNGCQGKVSSVFNASTNAYSYTWKFGDRDSATSQNPQHLYVKSGNYQIKLTAITKEGCTDSDSVTVAIYPTPQAKYFCKNFCLGDSMAIIDSSISAISYLWDFGDGDTSSMKNPKHIYKKPGNYHIALTLLSVASCIDTASTNITVNPSAQADFSAKNYCKGDSTSFTNQTIGGSSYIWDFGDSTSSTLQNPKHLYASAKNYSVSLFASNIGGCSNSKKINITVNPKPKSDFSVTNVCPGDSSVFIDKSVGDSAYSWLFGDGGISLVQSPKHLYKTVGAYSISLKTIGRGGCTDLITKKISLSACVWPGDANNDKAVDMNDFLAVGIAYGTKGHQRPSANSTWTGQPSADWDSVFGNGTNYKHADCNGDSMIDYKDTLAISANYGKSHPKSGGVNQGSPSDPGLTIKYLNDTFYAGDTLIAQVNLGSAINPIKNLYGLSFSVTLDPAIFETNNAYLKINPSFLGTNGIDLMAMNKNLVSKLSMDIGICKINHLNVSGYGNIATLYIPVNSVLPQKSIKASLALSNNIQISYNQKTVPLYLTSDSFLLQQNKSDIKGLSANQGIDLQIYPNPFQNSTIVQYNLVKQTNVKMMIYDITGKEAGLICNKQQSAGNHELTIDSNMYKLLPGIYFLKVLLNDQSVSKCIIKL